MISTFIEKLTPPTELDSKKIQGASSEVKYKISMVILGFILLTIGGYFMNKYLLPEFLKLEAAIQKMVGYAHLVFSVGVLAINLTLWKNKGVLKEFSSLIGMVWWVFGLNIIGLDLPSYGFAILYSIYGLLNLYSSKSGLSFLLHSLFTTFLFFSITSKGMGLAGYAPFIYLVVFALGKPYLLSVMNPSKYSIKAIVAGWAIVIFNIPVFMMFFQYHFFLTSIIFFVFLYYAGKLFYNQGKYWVEKPFQMAGFFYLSLFLILLNGFYLKLTFADMLKMGVLGFNLDKMSVTQLLEFIQKFIGMSLEKVSLREIIFANYYHKNAVGFLGQFNFSDKFFYLNWMFLGGFGWGIFWLKNLTKKWKLRTSGVVMLFLYTSIVLVLTQNSWVKWNGFAAILVGMVFLIWCVHFLSKGIDRNNLSFVLLGGFFLFVYVQIKTTYFVGSEWSQNLFLVALGAAILFFIYLIAMKIKDDKEEKMEEKL